MTPRTRDQQYFPGAAPNPTPAFPTQQPTPRSRKAVSPDTNPTPPASPAAAPGFSNFRIGATISQLLRTENAGEHSGFPHFSNPSPSPTSSTSLDQWSAPRFAALFTNAFAVRPSSSPWFQACAAQHGTGVSTGISATTPHPSTFSHLSHQCERLTIKRSTSPLAWTQELPPSWDNLRGFSRCTALLGWNPSQPPSSSPATHPGLPTEQPGFDVPEPLHMTRPHPRPASPVRVSFPDLQAQLQLGYPPVLHAVCPSKPLPLASPVQFIW